MKVKTNPIIDIEHEDMVSIRKTIRLCDELLGAVSCMTISDEAAIICADNGEVLVTEKELYTVMDVLTTMDRIFNEAPSAYDGSGHKELAVEFIN